MTPTQERVLKSMQAAYPRPLVRFVFDRWGIPPKSGLGRCSFVAQTRIVVALVKEGLVVIKGRRAILTPAGVEWTKEEKDEAL